MNIPENCRGTFLSGITDVYFYPYDVAQLPMPFNVGQISQMGNCFLGDVSLHVAIAGEEYVIADSITAKVTPAIAQNGTTYTFEVTANVTDGGENVREAYKNMREKDYYIVLRRVDGTLLLCYTMPNTFSIKYAVSATTSDETCTITASTKAMSDFIPITLK